MIEFRTANGSTFGEAFLKVFGTTFLLIDETAHWEVVFLTKLWVEAWDNYKDEVDDYIWNDDLG